MNSMFSMVNPRSYDFTSNLRCSAGAALVERTGTKIRALKQRSAPATADNCLQAETIREMQEAGFFCVLQPQRHGGFELPLSQRMVPQPNSATPALMLSRNPRLSKEQPMSKTIVAPRYEPARAYHPPKPAPFEFGVDTVTIEELMDNARDARDRRQACALGRHDGQERSFSKLHLDLHSSRYRGLSAAGSFGLDRRNRRRPTASSPIGVAGQCPIKCSGA